MAAMSTSSAFMAPPLYSKWWTTPLVLRTELVAPGLRLGSHIGRCGAAKARARLDRIFYAEHLEDLAGDALVDLLEILDGEPIEPAALGLRRGHGAARDMVRIAERHIGNPHQPVGKIGGGGKPGPCCSRHLVGIDAEIAHHAGHGRKAKRE